MPAHGQRGRRIKFDRDGNADGRGRVLHRLLAAVLVAQHDGGHLSARAVASVDSVGIGVDRRQRHLQLAAALRRALQPAASGRLNGNQPTTTSAAAGRRWAQGVSRHREASRRSPTSGRAIIWCATKRASVVLADAGGEPLTHDCDGLLAGEQRARDCLGEALRGREELSGPPRCCRDGLGK